MAGVALGLTLTLTIGLARVMGSPTWGNSHDEIHINVPINRFDPPSATSVTILFHWPLR